MRTSRALACAFAVLLLGGVSAVSEAAELVDPRMCSMPGYGFELEAPKGMEVDWQVLKHKLLDPDENLNDHVICFLRSSDRKVEVKVRIAKLLPHWTPYRVRSQRERVFQYEMKYHLGKSFKTYKELERDPDEATVMVGSIEVLETCLLFDRHWSYDRVIHKVCAGYIEHGGRPFLVFVKVRGGHKVDIRRIKPTLDAVLEGIELFPAQQAPYTE